MSESHQLNDRTECRLNTGEFTGAEALPLSELPAEELDEDFDGIRDAIIASMGQEGIRAMERFQAEGQVADIDTAIENFESTVYLTRDGHPMKPIYLSNLGTSRMRRFDCLGETADIDEAIELRGQAVTLSPDGHPNNPMYLNNLGTSHQERFRRLGEIADIDKAIDFQCQAVELTPDGHPDKPGRLNNLGNSHLARFKRLGEMADIDKAIDFQFQAVDFTPDGHPDKPIYLNNLGTSHQAQFERLGKIADIGKAIEFQCQAVELTPDGHSDKPARLSNLGISHVRRFEHLGEMADMNKAIELKRQAVDLTPDGHADKPIYLNNLGTSHQAQFERLGEMADIDKAIEFQCHAVELTPDGHPDQPMYLNNLGTSHVRRYERLGEIADVNKAIDLKLQAVDLTPDGHPNKPMYLNDLGNSYQALFDRLGEMADIDKAIDCRFQAVELTPDGHPNKPIYLNNLGISQQERFKHLGEVDDIGKAIEFQRQAVDLTLDDHPDKPARLNNLGNSHQACFENLGMMADIDKAIEYQLSAVELTPEGHPNKALYLNNLGYSHQARFERLGEIADIDEAIINFQQCALSTTGPPIVRFKAARLWVFALRLKNKRVPVDTSSLQPQHTFVNLIPELVWLGAPVHQRFQTIQDVVGSSIHEAVSAAIRAQELELAVEWMEQGRSIVWGQLRQLRSPMDDLHDAHPVLAQELQDIQRKIEMSFLPRDVDSTTELALGSLEQQAQAHRCNIQKRQDLLTEIRSNQGFESFLRPEKFSVLSKACQDRLTVLLTVAEGYCDALVILPSSSITHISFTNMSQDVISELHTLWENSRMSRLSNRGNEMPALFNVDNHTPFKKATLLETGVLDRGEEAATLDLGPMSSLLADLWERIVHPIVVRIKNLFDLTNDRLPRITWCPSGPLTFLPFHAAGIYSSDSEERICISDYAVSSYTPSLMALLTNPTTVQLGRPSILMVTQPNTPGQKALPGTTVEAKKITEKAASNDMQSAIRHLSQSEATVSAVIEQLETHGWVHLACHGTQKYSDPMESSFALHDGSLTLASLMRKSMGRAQFAFLAACQTATGAKTLADEAMHLTSGMLAAGYPSVVGTMWSIEDSVAPEVAEAFYAILFEEGYKSDWKVNIEPAYALHLALKKLREETTRDRDLMKWIPFVHYGR
ncbi:CHAT domain-containing protein [Flagelloscypha sp. PMI_526]|nr:CHAT domain-containing protein [Flagelloscypha sp. PMI_526]